MHPFQHGVSCSGCYWSEEVVFKELQCSIDHSGEQKKGAPHHLLCEKGSCPEDKRRLERGE